jgi:NADPH-dependent glutamate synthase beta subunit-like oxidoreductase
MSQRYERVTIIGAGPSRLTADYELAKNHYKVTGARLRQSVCLRRRRVRERF